VRGDPLATDQSQPTSHRTSPFTTSQTRTSHFTPACQGSLALFALSPCCKSNRGFMQWSCPSVCLLPTRTDGDGDFHVSHLGRTNMFSVSVAFASIGGTICVLPKTRPCAGCTNPACWPCWKDLHPTTRVRSVAGKHFELSTKYLLKV